MILAGNLPGWRGAPVDVGGDLDVEKGHIFKVGPYDLAISQVVIVKNEAIKRGPIGRDEPVLVPMDLE